MAAFGQSLKICKLRYLRKADILALRGIKAWSAAAHRRAAPRHGDLVVQCALLGGFAPVVGIKCFGSVVGSPHRGPSMRSSFSDIPKGLSPGFRRMLNERQLSGTGPNFANSAPCALPTRPHAAAIW